MINPSIMEVGDTHKDNKVSGLSLRKNRQTYSWMIWYKTRSGVERRPKIGSYPETNLSEARKIAKELQARVALGEDPAGEWRAKKSQGSVFDLCNRFLNDHAYKLRSINNVESTVNRHIRPALGKYKIGEVEPEHIQALHRKVSRTAPTQANRVVAICSKMFNLAEKWGYRPRNTNPCYGIDKNRENKRYRVMKPEEAIAIGRELSREDPLMSATIKLLMMTGARRGEFAGRVLQREGSLVFLDTHKTGTGKFIRLPDIAIKLIEDEGLDGVRLPSPSGVSHAWLRVRRRAGVKDLKLHDLRHTFASAGLSSGVSLSVIGGLLGHSDPRMTQRYAHLVDETGDRAVNLAADRVNEMLGAN